MFIASSRHVQGEQIVGYWNESIQIQELSSSKFWEWLDLRFCINILEKKKTSPQFILHLWSPQPELLGLSEAHWPFLSTSKSISKAQQQNCENLWQLQYSCSSFIFLDTCFFIIIIFIFCLFIKDYNIRRNLERVFSSLTNFI